jgi:glycosyltransferase involved in cell wall biosynthesis
LVWTLRRHGFAAPDVLWFSDLAQAAILDLVRPRVTVFHVTDDYCQFPSAPASVAQVEQEIARRADLILVTHPRLAAKFAALDKSVHYLPHGVEAERFELEYTPPTEYAAIPQPRVVYVGAIAEWMAWDVLDALASALSDCSLVFIGTMTATSRVARERWSSLLGRPNVHWVGPRRRDEVPAFLQHADVGIIPFEPGGLKQSSNPMKVYEYRASGLPIGSTWPVQTLVGDVGIPMLATWEPRAFVCAVQTLLAQAAQRREAYRGAGRAFARAQSWRVRFAQVAALLRPFGVEVGA